MVAPHALELEQDQPVIAQLVLMNPLHTVSEILNVLINQEQTMELV